GPTLQAQISYQLHRNEVVRLKKRNDKRVEVLPRGTDAPIIEVRNGGNHVRRNAFRAASFATLAARAPEALRDLQTVLARVADTPPPERIELLRLGFMLAKSSRQIALGSTILLADAMPAPTDELVVAGSLEVRFAAMNFYNLLELDPKLRQANNVK